MTSNQLYTEKTSAALLELANDWQRHQKKSLLKETQCLTPEKWEQFYNAVSDSWEDMSGLPGGVGNAVARHMQDQKWVSSQERVLDIGCGPGGLSLSLAAMGVGVTALDRSKAMIAALEKKIRLGAVKGIETVNCDWNTYAPVPRHDMATACFFPDAFSPQGLRRMESLSAGKCLLVFGDGTETFPLRRQIWKTVIGASVPDGRRHLPYLSDYLTLCGRAPSIGGLSLPALAHVPFEKAEKYFQAYFAIFGKTGPGVRKAIADVLWAHTVEDRVRLSGTANIILLFWRAQPDRPILIPEP